MFSLQRYSHLQAYDLWAVGLIVVMKEIDTQNLGERKYCRSAGMAGEATSHVVDGSARRYGSEAPRRDSDAFTGVLEYLVYIEFGHE